MSTFLKKTAILVDGGFYRRRAQSLWGEKTAADRATELYDYCIKHLFHKNEDRELYRIFYYDCPPAEKKVYHPLLKQTINLKESDIYTWSNLFLDELKNKRKVAVRLGELAEAQAKYLLRDTAIKKLCNGSLKIEDLKEKDFFLDITQKGVDMRIGLDIASMAYKNQVNQIILISGDSDFVPAAKLARREGIDFILDPMRFSIRDNLSEHVDGIESKVPIVSSIDDTTPNIKQSDELTGQAISLSRTENK